MTARTVVVHGCVRPRSAWRRFWRVLAVVAVGLGSGLGMPAADAPPAPPALATISVRGLGWWKNRDTRILLERLLGQERGATMDANAIEDAAFLLISRLGDEGFLDPRLKVSWVSVSGAPGEVTFDATLGSVLPRRTEARAVEFTIERGVRSTIDAVRIEGLHSLEPADAEAYFKSADTLWQSGSARLYSPSRLQRSSDALQDELRIRGYNEATVESSASNSATGEGEIEVTVEVNQGPRWQVSSLRVEGLEGTEVVFNTAERVGRDWTPFWQQDLAEALRKSLYAKGYPDVTVAFEREVARPVDGVRAIAVVARVTPGSRVRVGQVRFLGNDHSQPSMLRRRVRLNPGDPLNPLSVERARFRLGRLGVFSSVKANYDPASGSERDVVFSLVELPRWDTSFLFGYGSYEQLRGGVEWRQMNVFGRGHQSRLTLVQSLKSSRADYLYTVPELFGETLDGSARLFGLRREETSFLREEYGVNAMLRKRLGRGLEARAGYTYQALTNDDNELATRDVDDRQVTVGSVELGATLDRRDNPLRPRRGYRAYAQLEDASKWLGSEVAYQVFEAGAAYHTSWGRSRWLHFSLSHGVITTLGAQNDRDLPVNKRFFPGGDSDVRGYQQGEAAPRGPDGRFIGAKSRVTANIELEQGLTGNWSGVVFVDALGIAVKLADYPFSERLTSVGLGLRYQWIVGPIRLEYGYNLNRRPFDPTGTLHLSVGYPF